MPNKGMIGRELHIVDPDFQVQIFAEQEPNGCKQRQENCDKHAANAHADVIKMPLDLYNAFPDFDDLPALLVFHFAVFSHGNLENQIDRGFPTIDSQGCAWDERVRVP